MASTLAIVAGAIVALLYVFLRLLLYCTQDAREPPAIETGWPFIGPLVGMLREKSRLHFRLRKQYRLPIYTLRMPFQRIYVVNSPSLIPELEKQWRAVSFAAIAADAGHVVGMSKEAQEIMHRDLMSEHSFSLEPIRSKGRPVKVGLYGMLRKLMEISGTEAIWGPQNPYRDSAISDAWRTFENGFLFFSMFPFATALFPKFYQARELVAAAMMGFVRNRGFETASGLVRKRYEHHSKLFGLGTEDIARGEIGNTFAVLGNIAPCAWWVIFHLVSDARVLSEVREELLAAAHEDESGCHLDIASLRERCPVLLSTFQETLRYRAVNPGPRVILDDVALSNGILLKKGSMLMIPARVHHTDTTAWGEDAGKFDHLRFTRKPTATGQKKYNRVAFRAFGGGDALCPGRHLASNEIMALAALIVLQFVVVPVGGKWPEPTFEKSPPTGFPIPDKDIQAELHPRDPNKKWNFTFSGAEEAIGFISEDAMAGARRPVIAS
ncbi:cytochrome P450 [Apiospora aurea]|uniref:Cytochrome P450 n=1 Tax=Apiospora aurea TaxID=335848 RepID=A0ABR1QI50_9PEZI